jgi:AraC-like DNA-binding protein
MTTLDEKHTLSEIANRFAGPSLPVSSAGGYRWHESFDREFPFLMEPLGVSNAQPLVIPNGRDAFTLIMPLDGRLQIDMGARHTGLAAGEILIADQLTSAMTVTARPAQVQVLVISFLPAFVYSLGSPCHDYSFLLPFYSNSALKHPVVREHSSLQHMHRIIARLLECYLDRNSYFEIGCKAHFMQLLYHLARHFRDADFLQSEMILNKERTARLAPVLEFVQRNYAQIITLKEAACLAKMSVSQFVRQFKRVAGMSFVSYLSHVRLSHSLRLLKESSLTIAEIACAVGFSDQSYFDRRFKAAFRHTPRDFRARAKPDRTHPQRSNQVLLNTVPQRRIARCPKCNAAPSAPLNLINGHSIVSSC